MDHGFRFHDHTADITIECWAPTLETAFEEAALASFEVILDSSTVTPTESVEIETRGYDIEELLVEWVGYLIALIDITGRFYSKFEVDDISKEAEEYVLKGRAIGETINFDKHDTRTEVKAMTYADMKIDQQPDKTTLCFTLDL
ncbi:MAG: archease [Candidatus Thorarchaeota archaeon]|nr:archease [Candidatus Thorarchaeota archaeon]TFH10283.1 MAG: archease [Candidatus Thorarchaeota archaeon]